MVHGGQTRIGQFLTAVAQGFVQTRAEILVFFLLLIALLLVFCLYFALQKRGAHRELAGRSREMLEHLLGRIDLEEEEIALLGRLAGYRARGESQHSLLINHHVFDACAQRMRQSEGAPEAQLNSLRLKIGLRIAGPGDAPGSSTELPEGSPVLLVAASGARFRGTIIAQGPEGMLVKVDPGASAVPKGVDLACYFHNPAGIFSFPTRVTEVMDDAARVAHSSRITHYQRRKYYRRKESLPVFIRPASAAAVPQETLLLDLGGGGARLQNPRGVARVGDLLEVSFTPAMGEFTLAARVLRIAKKGKVIGVKFVSISETERNRIMAFLFAQSERRRGSRQGDRYPPIDTPSRVG